MLSMKRCPHTGVVNYFDASEPLFAVGSVMKARGRKSYDWRCYAADGDGAGRAPDLKTAERHLVECYGLMHAESDYQVRAA